MANSNGQKPSLPRFHQRAFAHNYFAPFIYHIIMRKKEDMENFGVVRGDARIAPGNRGCAYIEESILGKIIAKSIIGIQRIYPILQIYQFVVMPDHVHILLRVKDWSDYHLDYYMEELVRNIAASYSNLPQSSKNNNQLPGNNNQLPGNNNPSVKNINYPTERQNIIQPEEIFEPGYCDKPLLLKRKLDSLFVYIRENPHRLAMRIQFPQFFRRIRNLKIDNVEYEAYGNLFLLRNPDKEAVKISRKFSSVERAQKEEYWLSEAGRGTIIVSPFISPAEKAIRRKVEELNGSIILITHESFPERFKPAAHDFELCSSGRLLIISLREPYKTPLSRQLCLHMNDLAEKIAAM